MTDGGESLSKEAINPTTGSKIRHNPRDTSALNYTKTRLKIGNWNVQGLNSPGKINVLAEECENYSLDIVALTELHWPGQGKTRHGKWEVIYSGPDSIKREHTVGLMLSPSAAKSLLSYE